MEPNRPRSRDKNVTSGGNGVHRRGEGLGTGPVGQGGPGRPSGGGNGVRAGAIGGGSIIIIIIAVVLALSGNGSLANMLLGGGGAGDYSTYSDYNNTAPSGFNYANNTAQNGGVSAGGGTVDNSVASGSRDKYTTILGGGQDTVTMMIYMCGTDLESKNGMASSDMQEMANASFGDNLNILIYTGGCAGWKTSGISNKTNQIYQLKNGGLKPLIPDDGAKSMTEPATLSHFIQYCSEKYPANRYELILWDHGGGSVSGYGYDEKYKSAGSMGLNGIRTALKNGGVQFDFIGFDACLMATTETALMLDPYADYLIASEETEPGIGWYYTNWVSKLGADTSMKTLDIGKNIVDDFVAECGRRCAGQKTTLSVIDLAEFANTVPADLAAFSQSVSQKLQSEEYAEISNARYGTREFAQSSKIDQIDLVHFAENVGTDEGKQLSKTLKSAVKYNRTSSNMTNAYGVSIFFPYKRTSYVDKACRTYDQIGMDGSYANCIRQFASLETSGQAGTGGTASPVGSLFDLAGSLGSSGGSTDMIGSLLTGFLSSGRGIEGLDSSNTEFMKSNPLSAQETTDYISMHYFDPSNLIWVPNDRGDYTMKLPESQWALVHSLDLNMFYDDGSGYVDMGYDNVYGIDENGCLVADTDCTWVSINGQPVAYYHTDTMESGRKYTISGYVPCMVNGERMNLILVFDQDNPDGYIAGATTDYVGGETETVAKSLTELQVGDTLEFLCDYYSYDQTYQDSYYLGEPMTVTETMTISNTKVGDGACKLMYRFTDIYDQQYWSAVINK